MAKFTFLFTLSILLLSTLSFGDATPTNITIKVCDPARFASLGLDVSDFAYCDKSLAYDVRAKDLVDRMTLQEKVDNLGNGAKGVSRIGLPQYEWWSEALHGVAKTGPGTFFDDDIPGATSFPTVILSAASFNASLWKKLGQVVSNEAKAMNNLGHAGLTFWSPNINVARDPRWGRNLETPGEDPFVVGTYAVNYVRGLQDIEGQEYTGDLNLRPLKISACCKHYAAYDVESWLGVDRWHFDARVTEQDMIETFLRPFEMCVTEGDVSSVMCSFNRVNGIPTCADPKLLRDTIRGDWNLHGYISSDCDSIDTLYTGHHWLNDTQEDAVAHVLKAGLDIDCGTYYTDFGKNAVLTGKVKEADIDKALNYLYVLLMRVGFFDGNPTYASLGKGDICSKDNIELAAEAAREGIVLLKNDENTLPLKSSEIQNIALIGPHANATKVMIGNYAGIPCQYTSPIDGFSKFTKVAYAMGCGDVACSNYTFFDPALEAARNSDVTVLFMGLDLSVEAEGRDRLDLLLPGNQADLINKVADAAKGPVILVIMASGSVDISFAKNNPKIKSIIWAGYPGEEGGRAIAEVVFGIYNPGGRLPLTWHEPNYVNQLPMTSMKLRPVEELGYPGRTYKFFDGPTIYQFGYGMSYTQFNYVLKSSSNSLDINLDKFQHCRTLDYKNGANIPSCPAVLVEDLDCSNEFQFEIEVQNIGSVDGDNVLIVYSKPAEGIVGTHQKQVIGFERIHVPAGGSKTVQFVLNACKSLSIVDQKGYLVLPSGVQTITVGNDEVSFPIQVKFQTSN